MSENKIDLNDVNKIISTCSMCGKCLNTCPAYQKTLKETDSPRGRINIIESLLNGDLKTGINNYKFLEHCRLCGACEKNCTKGVKYFDLILKARDRRTGIYRRPLFERIKFFFLKSVLFKLFTFRSKHKNIIKNDVRSCGESYDVLLIPGCVMKIEYRDKIRKCEDILRRCGFSVYTAYEADCCGFPFLAEGESRKTEELMNSNNALFNSVKHRFKVSLCPLGALMLERFYNYDNVSEISDFINRKSEVKLSLNERYSKDTEFILLRSSISKNLLNNQVTYEEWFKNNEITDIKVFEDNITGFTSIFDALRKKTLEESEFADLIRKSGIKRVIITDSPGILLFLSKQIPSAEVLFCTDLID